MLSTRRGKRLVAGIVVVLSMWIDHCQSAPRDVKVAVELRTAPVAPPVRVQDPAPLVAPRPHPTQVKLGPPDVTWSKHATPRSPAPSSRKPEPCTLGVGL
jgi:hypothetical protein